jgi:hypothetical protein
MVSPIGGQHGVVLIVVPVHSISTDPVQIGASIRITAQVAKLAAYAKVPRICAPEPHESAADHIFSFDECITGGLV